MYHRIAEPPYDPWGLSVAPRLFSEQLRELSRKRTLLSMDQLAARLRRRALRGNEVAITFDDGYVDNLAVAKPLLTNAGAPATVFVTTGLLGSDTEFWWDELAHLCLGGVKTVAAVVELGGCKYQVELSARLTPSHSNWFYKAPPQTERERLYLELWQALQRLDDTERAAGMQCLRDVLGPPPVQGGNLPMQREDLRRLVAGGLITVGGHACTHPALTLLPKPEKRAEIEGCRRELEQLTGGPISGFAYPFGDRDDEAKDMTRAAGYSWAVCTHAAAIDRGQFDLFDLPRMQVMNWTGSELLRKLDGLAEAV
jgi:peptidoglycan/xylan/chitin deacetylase (PgdA/CDA1 family)